MNQAGVRALAAAVVVPAGRGTVTGEFESKPGKATMRVAVLTAVLLAVIPHAAFSQSADELRSIRQDIEALKEGQAAIRKDLLEIKTLLRARPTAAAPAQEVVLAVGDAPSRGSKDARLVLVEFTDYQ